jgi:hypothetical protein
LPATPPQASRQRFALSLALWISLSAPAVLGQGVDVMRLEAAFVAKFPAFVHWPAPVWQGRESVFICVYRSEAVASYLRELVAGERVNGRPLTVRTVGGRKDLDACHVLFIPERAEAGLVAAVAGRPVLTIGLDRAFLDAGGIIALSHEDRRIRFEVDRAAADRAGLQLSSQLLRLAAAVHGRPR